VVTEGKETEQVVWEAVERLPRLWRVAVVLHYREEKGIADIAKIMDTRENTVKTYLFRGRQKLREMLSEALGEDCNAGK
jgi:RNA polymerase sigma-70 factor (ECF subfamily)